MKKTIKNVSAFALASFLLAILVTSCKKSSSSERHLNGSNSTVQLTSLLDKFFQPATDELIKEVSEIYSNLTPAEANEFLVLKNAREQLELSQLEKNKYTADQFDLLKRQTTLIGEYRLELNQLAQERYGLGINKLDNSKFEELSNEIFKADKYLILGTSVSENNLATANGSNAVLACATSTWPYSCPRITFTGGLGYYGEFRIDNDPNATFCDYEYRFNGVYNRVRGERVVDNNVIGNGLGRRSILYSDGYDTGLIVGYNTKVAWLGTNNLYCRVTNR